MSVAFRRAALMVLYPREAAVPPSPHPPAPVRSPPSPSTLHWHCCLSERPQRLAEPPPQPVAAATAAATAASSSSGGGGEGVSLEASVRLAGVGISVIDSYPRELLYLTVGDIALDYLREGQVRKAVGCC